MRNASMEEIQASMREHEEEVSAGVGFQRVGGSAKIQIQPSLAARVKDIRSACAPLSLKLQEFLDKKGGGLLSTSSCQEISEITDGRVVSCQGAQAQTRAMEGRDRS